MSRKAAVTKFRHNGALMAGAIIALIGALPVALSGPWLLPILLIPLAILIWAWRGGVNADTNGITVRALLASRRLPWSEIDSIGAVDGRVHAVLRSGRAVPLPAVRPDQLPRLVEASGEHLQRGPGGEVPAEQ